MRGRAAEKLRGVDRAAAPTDPTVSWQCSLARRVPYTKPKRGELRTLADARAYALKRDPGTTDQAWQHAMKLMMEAAEGGDIDAVTKQLELALLIDGALDLSAG